MYKIAALASLAALVLAGGGEIGEAPEEDASKEIVYVGTYSGRGSQGLYVFAFDRRAEQLAEIQAVGDRKGPNFQALHPEKTHLYSVSGESLADDASGHGTITAYRIDQETGALARLNAQSTEGAGPAHVSIDPKGRFAYVSNFSSGSLSVFAIQEDGRLSEAVEVVQHEGSSINERRQSGPHVHSVIPSPDGRFIYVSDMGTDEIMVYVVDRDRGTLSLAQEASVEASPGAGPRHFTLHPEGGFAYSLQQISSTVAVYRRNPSTGALTRIQRVDLLPDDFEGENQAADVHISPDGAFLYASNRGHNSLAIFRIDAAAGTLSLVDHEPTRGAHPRNFMIDKQGAFVFVANRDDDEVVIFERDQQTGQLRYAGERAHVPKAVCLTQLFVD